MAVISFVSAKGGVGKTTLAVNAAVELAFRGTSVTVVDCDINQHAVRFGGPFSAMNPTLPLRFISGLENHTVLSAIQEGAKTSDVVVVDLPAGTGQTAFKAIMKSHLVVIPSQKQVFDVRDAARTAVQVAEAEDCIGSPIGSVLVWTRVPARFETLSERTVRNEFSGMLIDSHDSILPVAMLEYDAYPASFLGYWALRQVAGRAGQTMELNPGQPETQVLVPRSAAKAAENIGAIVDALTARIEEISNNRIRRVHLLPEFGATVTRSVALEA